MERKHFGLAVKALRVSPFCVLHLSVIPYPPCSTGPGRSSPSYSIILLIFSVGPSHVLSSCFHSIILPAIPFLLRQHKLCSSFRTPVRSQKAFPDPIGGTLFFSLSLTWNLTDLIPVCTLSLRWEKIPFARMSIYLSNKILRVRDSGLPATHFSLWSTEQGSTSHNHQLASGGKVPLHLAQ